MAKLQPHRRGLARPTFRYIINEEDEVDQDLPLDPPPPPQPAPQGPLPWVSRWDGFTYTIKFPCCPRARVTTNRSITDPEIRRCPLCLKRYARVTAKDDE